MTSGMTYLAICILTLALLVGLGRRPLMIRAQGRLLSGVLAFAAAAAVAVAVIWHKWVDGLILLGSAAWFTATASDDRYAPPVSMRRDEAAALLGVSEGADREEVEAAYRRLMFRVHPDQGGAAGLAAQINAARKTLLWRKR
jgi:hypothetical protein